MAYKMKGFRNSPLKVTDFENMTEEERRALHEQMKSHPGWLDTEDDDSKRQKMHRPNKDGAY